MGKDQTVLGNVYDKYSTKNPVARFLFNGYLRGCMQLLNGISHRTALEVGCGEGRLTEMLGAWKPGLRIWGIDLSEQLFEATTSPESRAAFSVQSAYSLGFPEGAFDLVVGAEVLEHLEEPETALREIHRVASSYVLLSVPREPIWRVLNVARLSYLGSLGNTPGHLQHWSSREFVRFVSGHFDIIEVVRPLPWTLVLARKG